ncbi:hypothetical protein CVT24_009908 [Panaeolus cyanescens]|uniref:DUF4218 domain-containing protein n=1 Tax=Panaeolus cyanescens TaxID=181874 RepID=A0A409WW84_9AGAR|nr:hypothetical protein CVT24_009908 [Panaeolus cyanescens]
MRSLLDLGFRKEILDLFFLMDVPRLHITIVFMQHMISSDLRDQGLSSFPGLPRNNSAMPLCTCRRYCNGGAMVSKKVHNEHQPYRAPDVLEADPSAKERLEAALQFADRATKEQDRLAIEELSRTDDTRLPPPPPDPGVEDLQQKIAAMVLTDSCTGSQIAPGGRLWSGDLGAGSSQPIGHQATRFDHLVNTSNKRLEAEYIAKLDRYKVQIDQLRLTVDSLSATITPTHRHEPFPIQKEVDDIYSIRLCLERRWADETKSVQKYRINLASSAVAIIENLKPKQSSWRTLSNEFPEEIRNDIGAEVYDTSHHFQSFLTGYEPPVQLCLLLVVALQVLAHASRRAGRLTLYMLSLVLKSMLGWPHKPLTKQQEGFVKSLPTHPDTVTGKFNLETKHTIYAVCPNMACHKLYKPTYKPGSQVPIYPKRCDHQEFPNGPLCGTVLTQSIPTSSGQVYRKPIKRFIAFDLKDWISGLLSRTGYEDKMDNAWSRQASTHMDDVFDGQFLKDFKYKDGSLFASHQRDNQARYALSMSVDFFNPRRNSSHSVSCGIISLVNFNLPPHERYRAENVFLAGIIPGPKEPPADAMNHYLEPVVDQLDAFWNPGVYFSRTAKYPAGRLVILALIILICDLPAARKTAGMASVKHTFFCSSCHASIHKEGYGSTDFKGWRRRTKEEYEEGSKKWLAAKTDTERTAVFNTYTTRWSAFSKLSYFDIHSSLAVDAMHNLFLGLLKDHAHVLGIGIKRDGSKESALSTPLSLTPSDGMTEREHEDLADLLCYIQTPLQTTIQEDPDKVSRKLNTFLHSSLLLMVQELRGNVSVADGSLKKMTKADLIAILIEWRKTQPEHASRNVNSVLNSQDLKVLQDNISNVVKPTWLTSLPPSLGGMVNVTLKADQWRVFGTVYLPLTLVVIWKLQNPGAMNTESQPVNESLKNILDCTMYLIQAIIVATSGTMKADMAELYLNLMLSYMRSLKNAFPTYKFKPNNHMSLHLSEHLRNFGPVHSWWTFPFERVIGMVQRIPTNNILGQLEETLALSFHRSSNLRNLFRSTTCPRIYSYASSIFERLFSSRTSDTVVTGILKVSSLFGRDIQEEDKNADDLEEDAMSVDVSDDSDVRLDDRDSSAHEDRAALYTQLFNTKFGSPLTSESTTKISVFRTLTKDGIRFSSHTHHLGNSLINFSDNSKSKDYQWGRIEHFISTSKSKDKLVILRRFRSDNTLDNPFEPYPLLRGQLLLALDESDALEVILPEQIISHFACLQVQIEERSLLPAISLSRRF